MKFVTTRPSSGRMRGPYVLKIRRMRTSNPRRKLSARVSPNRLLWSYWQRFPVVFTLPRYAFCCGWLNGSPTSEVDVKTKRAFI
eukprot:12170_2